MTLILQTRRHMLKSTAATTAVLSLARFATFGARAEAARGSKEVLGSIDQTLRQAAEAKDVPGVVAMAATDDGVLYQGAFGSRNLANGSAMTLDSVFWIASMTKAITSTAAMQLVEQGKLQLDQPIGGILPELSAPQVLEGFDDKGEPKLRAAKRPITLRHLLTHTAGFTYDFFNADTARYEKYAQLPPLASGKNAALRTPLAFDPGDRWEYGINTDYVGKAVEVASGKRLDAYLHDHILAPLGMVDTGFVPGPDQQARLVSIHGRTPDGSLAPVDFPLVKDPEFYSGGGGLYSTAYRLSRLPPNDHASRNLQRRLDLASGNRCPDVAEPDWRYQRPEAVEDDRAPVVERR